VRIEIDHALCTGHGRCYELAPAVFGDDDEGYTVLLVTGEVPAELEPLARRAALNCPERAISVVD
jgi:ferredoxin